MRYFEKVIFLLKFSIKELNNYSDILLISRFEHFHNLVTLEMTFLIQFESKFDTISFEIVEEDISLHKKVVRDVLKRK